MREMIHILSTPIPCFMGSATLLAIVQFTCDITLFITILVQRLFEVLSIVDFGEWLSLPNTAGPKISLTARSDGLGREING